MAQALDVTVVYALADACITVSLRLAPGSRVADALQAADMPSRVPGLRVDPTMLAVFGVATAPERPLADGDRVEILRPLLADPKQARRARARSGKGA